MMAGYDPIEDMLKVKSVQKKWRDSFAGPGLDANKWTSQAGLGGSIAVAAGVLNLASGVLANDESWVLSTETFTIPFRVSVGLTLSQRIANQALYLEAVSINRETGLPDGQHMLGLLFDGTTATQAKYEVQNGGLARLTSAASTFPTTASAGLYEVEAFADESWFHGATLDASTGRANSYRRHQQIPDPNALYRLRLRWLNSATAPASSTSAVIQTLTVQDYAELTAEITAGRGQGAAGQALAVQIAAGGVTSQTGSNSTGNTFAVAKGYSANPSAGTSGRTTDVLATLIGAVVDKPFSIPEADWQYNAVLATTGDNIAKAAGAAGIRNYVTGIQVQNSSATGTDVQIKDGTTVIWRGYLPGSNNSAINIPLLTPLRGSAATVLNVAIGTAASSIYVNLQGYAAP